MPHDHTPPTPAALRIEPVRVEPVRVEPVRVEPVRVEPVRVEPVLVEPVLVEPVLVETVLGARSDAAFAARLHALEHRGRLDTVWLAPSDMARRRMVLRSAAGQQVAVALPRTQTLFDGAVLLLSDEAALVARAEAEHWLRLEPAAAEAALQLGYHAGNLHWRVRFEGGALLVALEGPADSYLARLGTLCETLTWRIETPSA